MTQHTLKLTAIKCFIFGFTMAMAGCASFAPKSNDDRFATLAGQEFVISVPANQLDLKRISAQNQSQSSIYRFVAEQDLALAKRSNRNQATSALKIKDPSSAILNSLNKYFQRKYQLKFIAKGSISNIDPSYIQRALKKGDLLIDVRVNELWFSRNTDNQFIPHASFQLTVIDRHKGKHIIKDRCLFSEPENAQSLSYFTANGGREISALLSRHATSCLRYFAQGTPLKNSASQPSPHRESQQTNHSTLRELTLSAGTSFYSDPLQFSTIAIGAQLRAPMNSKLAMVAQTQALHIQPTTDSNTSLRGAGAGFGYSFHPSANFRNGAHFLLIGQMAKYGQQNIGLSTNALGVELGVFHQVLGPLQAGVYYRALQHVGATKNTNELGHSLALQISFLLD